MARQSSLIQRFLGHLLCMAVVALPVVWSGSLRGPVIAQPPMPPAGNGTPHSLPDHLQWQGVASCASTACHGGNGPRGSKGSEYTTWILYDKHTKAYQDLSNERSQRIEKNLRHGVKEAQAEKDQLCLRCHAMNADNGPQRETFVRDFGIGCESCHGRAEKWLGLHYARDWRKAKSDSEKLTLGFQPLKKLGDRAKLCVSCHVGGADQDVNHDLIAAGHPRLNFEFGAFQATMPKHWSEEGENARPDFEARAWALGQVVSAQAALTLLEHRARTDSLPWPEFAEYECFACHHDLREPSWRQDRGHYANRTPGALLWGTWYLPTLPRALDAQGGEDAAKVQTVLDDLKKEMQKPSPNRERVAGQAHAASTQLSPLVGSLEKVHYDRTTVHRLFTAIRDDQKIAAKNWDEAAQAYLGQAALYNALREMGHGDPALSDSLKARAKQLEFPQSYDSPRDFEPK